MLHALSLFMIIFLASCASSPPAKESPSPETTMKEIESSRQVKEMNERLMMANLSAKKMLQKDYRIGPEDLIEITIFEDEKLNKTVRVSSQGNITLPLLGILKVKGLTGTEMEKEIRDLLAEKYFQDPHVSIFIKEYRNQRISLMGAVSKAGVYDFSGQKSVLDLLSMAGGLRDDAGSLLFILRPQNPESPKKEQGSDDQKPQTFVVSLEDLLIKGDLNMNLPLVHGDVVNVPSAGKVFVGGEVRSPGGFSLAKRLTVGQVITLAAGLTLVADGSQTRIFRYVGKDNQKEMIPINIYAIQKGEIEDPYVKENDIIFVPRSGAKVALSEFWDLLKGRIAGFPTAW
jgi:polysaccharide biosynthesis/export protein